MATVEQYHWLNRSKLWLVLDIAAAAPRSLSEITVKGIKGGVDVVLCRIKNSSRETVIREAMLVRNICSELEIPFVMSHFPEIAADLNADAVQIGVSDPPIEQIHSLVGDSMAVGFSAHSVEEAELSFNSGADYVFLGPVFPTPAKLIYGAPLGMDVVDDSMRLKGPVVHIGGIKRDNLLSLVERGVSRVAVISAIQRSAEPTAAAAHLKHILVSGIRPK